MAQLQFPTWFLAVLLALVMTALYWPATLCGFINFDDPDYVSWNLHVQTGMTLENIHWAFVNPVIGNWHPLTMLSLMLDCQIFGLDPWGHHLINVLLHGANTALVFLLFQRMTGATWRCLLLAALFGCHPLRVESVAWVSERKDVLSTLFGLLALICYTCHVEQLKIQNPKSKIYYGLTLLFFAFSLMSKPMLVTLPFVMLLLDYWPLQRMARGNKPGESILRLVREKTPFFLLAGMVSAVTYLAARQVGAVLSFQSLPLGVRIANALISYCRYLGKIFWPTDLAVHYPHPGHWPQEAVLVAGIFLCVISLVFYLKRERYPSLPMGWLWFIGTLVPVIGLVGAGNKQAMADHFTYIPSLGVLILAIWGAYELTIRWRYQSIILAAAGSTAVLLCFAVTRQQLGYWNDSETLFRHTLAVTKNNDLAHNNLGEALLDKGQINEAITQFQEAVRIEPGEAMFRDNLSDALLRNGQIDDALNQSREAVRLKPNRAESHINLGVVLLNKKYDNDEAISQFQEAIRLKPDDSNASYNLGDAFFYNGQIDEAIGQFQKTIFINPADTDAKSRLAEVLELKNQIDLCVSNPPALNDLAWQLATSADDNSRNGKLAVKLAGRACEQSHFQAATMIGTLAAAYAEAGQFDEAIATEKKACALASQLGETNLLKRNQELVVLYQSHQAYHEPPASTAATLFH